MCQSNFRLYIAGKNTVKESGKSKKKTTANNNE